MQPGEDWKVQGECYGSFSQVFFPDSYGAREAKEICRGCVVQFECLDYAIRTGQKFGVWGGMTYSQRQKIRKRGGLDWPEETV